MNLCVLTSIYYTCIYMSYKNNQKNFTRDEKKKKDFQRFQRYRAYLGYRLIL